MRLAFTPNNCSKVPAQPKTLERIIAWRRGEREVARKWRNGVLADPERILWFGVWSTPLSRYTTSLSPREGGPQRFNFLEYLHAKIAEAERKGAMLHVLDIGMGSGRQWESVATITNVELFATVLTLDFVCPDMKSRTTICTAGRLERHFPEGYFDIVVSHHGAVNQEKEALGGIVHVLKRGGEAVVCGSDEIPVGETGNGNFEVLARDFGTDGGWFYHIRKI